MKIVFYVEHFLPLSQTFILNQIHYFKKNNSVYIICQTTDGKSSEIENVTCLMDSELLANVSVRLRNKGLFSLASTLYRSKLKKTLANINPDIILCHFGVNAIDLLTIKSNHNTIVFFHGYDGSKLIHNFNSYRQCIKKLSGINNFKLLFVSKYLLDQAKKQINNLNAKVFHLGIPDYNLNTSKNPSSKIIITQISRLVPKKGIELSIEAIIKLLTLLPHLSENILFQIIGEGPLQNLISEKILETSFASNFKLWGALDHNSTLDILSKSNIYIQPSIIDNTMNSEGLSISVMEAIQCDNYVITTKHTGIEELVSKNDNFISICNPNSDELCEELQKIITSKKFILNKSKFTKVNFDFLTQMKLLEEEIKEMQGSKIIKANNLK